jgi:lipopolysaccharide-induced tumor necrosis factor-alpha factor
MNPATNNNNNEPNTKDSRTPLLVGINNNTIATTATTTTPQPMTMNNNYFTRLPKQTICQYCNTQIITEISYQPGLATHLTAGGICISGCICGCCLIPYTVDAFKDVVHECPNCKQIIGFRTVI